MRWPFNWLEPPEDTCSEPAFKEYFGVPALPLPEAVLPKISLQGAIAARLSCRRFMGAPLTMLQLATVLKCAYGVQGKTLSGDMELLERPVPSGGGLYPLELYALVQNVEGVEPGIYHYAALHHMLEQVQPVRLSKPAVSRLFMDQPYITGAAVIVVLVAVVERCLWKYGDRGYRYILFEAGHVAQNVNLVSSALELGSLNLGVSSTLTWLPCSWWIWKPKFRSMAWLWAYSAPAIARNSASRRAVPARNSINHKKRLIHRNVKESRAVGSETGCRLPEPDP
jgi:SagB-type dehydrogenase family enzyme